MNDQPPAADLKWVFRPAATRPEQVRALAGRLVHGTGSAGSDGEVEVVLGDGTHVYATPAEVVAE